MEVKSEGLERVEKIVKQNKNIFTKKRSNNIIRENYNPLKMNYKLICEKEGLYMEKTKDLVLSKIKKEANIDKVVLNCFYSIYEYYNMK